MKIFRIQHLPENLREKAWDMYNNCSRDNVERWYYMDFGESELLPIEGFEDEDEFLHVVDAVIGQHEWIELGLEDKLSIDDFS